MFTRSSDSKLDFIYMPIIKSPVKICHKLKGIKKKQHRGRFRNQRSAKGFRDSSVGKESTCSVGDPSSIPRLGRFTGEGIGYPLKYSWASLVAQLAKNLPTMRETWV